MGRNIQIYMKCKHTQGMRDQDEMFSEVEDLQ